MSRWVGCGRQPQYSDRPNTLGPLHTDQVDRAGQDLNSQLDNGDYPSIWRERDGSTAYLALLPLTCETSR
ncbi:MAG: hypothetical protein QOG75_3274 [Mycobacterium sp.]|jgi:hypothetical protein|nr:hypothetical protein [Mycobacterium sp.]